MTMGAGRAQEPSKSPLVSSAMIDSNTSPSRISSVAHSAKFSRVGEESGMSEVVAPSTASHHRSTVNSPSRRQQDQHPAFSRVEFLDQEGLDRGDRNDSRSRSHAMIDGGGESPGFFGAAMMMLRGGSTNVHRSGTSHGISASSDGIAWTTKPIVAVAAITPDEANGEPAAGRLLRDDDTIIDAVARTQHDRPHEPTLGPYQHALFTAPDSSAEHDSDLLPLVTIDVSSHERRDPGGFPCAVPGTKRRPPRTKHVVTHKKRKTVHMIQATGQSTATATASSKRTATTKPTVESGNVSFKKPSCDKPMRVRAPSRPGTVDRSDESSRPRGGRKRFDPSSTLQYGITQRASDKFQAQVFFAKKSRYIGVFPTADVAAVAVAEVKKALRKENPHGSDSDAAFKNARAVALDAMGIMAAPREPLGKGPARSRNEPSDKDSTRSTQKKAKAAENRKAKAKENQAQPTSNIFSDSKPEDDPAPSSLLLLASVAKDENDHDNKKLRPGSSTRATSSTVVKTGGTKSRDVAADDANELNSTAAELVKLSKPAAPKSVDPGAHTPEISPPSRAPSSPTPSSASKECVSPQQETLECVHSKKVHPVLEVSVVYDKSDAVFEVHVADDEAYPDSVVTMGPTEIKEEALELFKVVCSIAYHAGTKHSSCWIPEMVWALDLNKRMVPHLPPTLISGYLGIAFVVDSLDWHVYGYLKDKAEPALIGKYRIFVDAVFAYNTAAKMQRYPTFLEEHQKVACKVKEKVLSHIASTRPQCNIQSEHQLRFSLSNMRCMFAHGLSPRGGSESPPRSGSDAPVPPRSTPPP